MDDAGRDNNRRKRRPSGSVSRRPEAGAKARKAGGGKNESPARQEHPYEKTSAWLLSHYGEDPDCFIGFIDIDKVANALAIKSSYVTGCLTLLYRAGAVNRYGEDQYRWTGIRKVDKVTNHLLATSKKPFPGNGCGPPLAKRLAKGVNEAGLQKLSKFGVFDAAVQLVMASDDGVRLSTATGRLFDIVQSENAPGRCSRTNMQEQVSNVLHCMVGLGAIKKSSHSKRGDSTRVSVKFKWVGLPLSFPDQDQAPRVGTQASADHSDKKERVGGHAGPPKVVPLVRLAKEPLQTFSNRLCARMNERSDAAGSVISRGIHPGINSVATSGVITSFGDGVTYARLSVSPSGREGFKKLRRTVVDDMGVSIFGSGPSSSNTKCPVLASKDADQHLSTPVFFMSEEEEEEEEDDGGTAVEDPSTDNDARSETSAREALDAQTRKTAEMIAEANRQLEMEAIEEVRARFRCQEREIHADRPTSDGNEARGDGGWIKGHGSGGGQGSRVDYNSHEHTDRRYSTSMGDGGGARTVSSSSSRSGYNNSDLGNGSHGGGCVVSGNNSFGIGGRSTWSQKWTIHRGSD